MYQFLRISRTHGNRKWSHAQNWARWSPFLPTGLSSYPCWKVPVKTYGAWLSMEWKFRKNRKDDCRETGRVREKRKAKGDEDCEKETIHSFSHIAGLLPSRNTWYHWLVDSQAVFSALQDNTGEKNTLIQCLTNMLSELGMDTGNKIDIECHQHSLWLEAQLTSRQVGKRSAPVISWGAISSRGWLSRRQSSDPL